jgi:hypothetical protein
MFKMKKAMTILYVIMAVTSLFFASGAPTPASECYWDSECSSTSIQCCVGGLCRSEASCEVLRSYPLPNFQACYRNADCSSGCCNNNFCTWAQTCEGEEAAFPLVVFLLVLAAITIGLLTYLVKDIILYRKKK